MAAHHICRQLTSSSLFRSSGSGLRTQRFLHATSGSQAPRKRHFFSSNAILQQENSASNNNEQPPSIAAEATNLSGTIKKRKQTRATASKTSLRRVAAEAQRSRDNAARQTASGDPHDSSREVTAVCMADEFDMEAVAQILRTNGFPIDPYGTEFDISEVIHTRGANEGDIFVFPSGTVVAWSLPEDVVSSLATKILLPAAKRPHVSKMEIEDLEFKEDPTKDQSTIKGDVITLGTRKESQADDPSLGKVDTTLAKIAFSSGLARSTKLAVLETELTSYFDSTRSIPRLLSSARKLPFNSNFMLQKTGQLLELRAQLNHYSELTDSLPDLFWDSKYELGLETYYDQVGKALDVGIRIKTLNEKMDYAQEIATILRETLSERHMVFLEWIIILLILVEVVFGVKREWKEYWTEESSTTSA